MAEATSRYVDSGKVHLIYEEPIRDVILSTPGGEFGFEDVTGLPWIEIDFAEDLHRATREVFPQLLDLCDAAISTD